MYIIDIYNVCGFYVNITANIFMFIFCTEFTFRQLEMKHTHMSVMCHAHNVCILIWIVCLATYSFRLCPCSSVPQLEVSPDLCIRNNKAVYTKCVPSQNPVHYIMCVFLEYVLVYDLELFYKHVIYVEMYLKYAEFTFWTCLSKEICGLLNLELKLYSLLHINWD